MYKSELRKIYLQKRRSLSLQEWESKSKQVCEHLKASPHLHSAKTVLSYCSFRQEPDLQELLTIPKVWGLPRCVEETLSWHVWTPGKLRSNKFGIQEPDPNSTLINPEQVDLILVPCVMCDRRGYRLGYGGGFYDRLLNQPEWQGKSTIGIVFDFAVIDELSIDTWDQPLRTICTESGFI
ncbi:MAG: 5-formyltetrahydrofolate cyclo-ligase [Plectolyngbya sp. WJT66-NPBG17]|jgi:5-formyltetrahydrofolate cyclo-ligase|nr:5-formyltetrahydrofolate cyclo-ligase [Plectolyngbya sp. WJT66-NPBG17]